MVVIHSCQSTAQSYFQNSKIPWKQGSDKKGYITIWPSSPHSGTCWDVSSKQSLSHDGGGDTQAISNMILYAISQYKADPARVYVTGGSSGGMYSIHNYFSFFFKKKKKEFAKILLFIAMMSNVMAATYPELISAVSLYSGVPAGCFVSASGGVDQWNNSCSGGQSKATPEAFVNFFLPAFKPKI